jgi:predicted DNA repair protein MutK
MRAAILAFVALAITLGVYGAVGLIVKMDDVGLHMARQDNEGTRAIGRGIVHAMPKVMAALSVIGIAAMIWVGGGIIVHGLEVFGVEGPAHLIHDVAAAAGHAVAGIGAGVEWVVGAAGAGLIGLAVGGLIVAVHHAVAHRRRPRPDH